MVWRLQAGTQNRFFSEPASEYIENVLEIVPINGSQFYVRLDTYGENADRCKFFGVAELRDDRLTYRGAPEHFITWKRNPAPPPDYLAARDELASCELTFSMDQDGARIVVADVGKYCMRRGFCGNRAYFDGWDFPTGSRRDIKYMKRLKASPEYTSALEEAGLSPKR